MPRTNATPLARAAVLLALGLGSSARAFQNTVPPAGAPAEAVAAPALAANDDPRAAQLLAAVLRAYPHVTAALGDNTELQQDGFITTVVSDDAFVEIVASGLIGIEGVGARRTDIFRMRTSVGLLAARLSLARGLFYNPLTASIVARASWLEDLEAAAIDRNLPFEDLLSAEVAREVAEAIQDEQIGFARTLRMRQRETPVEITGRKIRFGQAEYARREAAKAIGGEPLLDTVLELSPKGLADPFGYFRDEGFAYVEDMAARGEMVQVWREVARPPFKLPEPGAEAIDARDTHAIIEDAIKGLDAMFPQGQWKFASDVGDLNMIYGNALRIVPPEDFQALQSGMRTGGQHAWADEAATYTRYLGISYVTYATPDFAKAAMGHMGKVIEANQGRLAMGNAPEDRPVPQEFAVDEHHTAMVAAGTHDNRGAPASSFVSWTRLGDTVIMINLFGNPTDHTMSSDVLPELLRRLAAALDPVADAPAD